MAEFDIESFFSGFSHKPLSDSAIWALSMATKKSPLPAGHVGYKIFISRACGTNMFYRELLAWSESMAKQTREIKPLLKKRRRAYVLSYKHSWGKFAAKDGLDYVLYGTFAPAKRSAEELGCDYEAYVRVRNMVAGSLLMALDQFKFWLIIVMKREMMPELMTDPEWLDMLS